jgi:hypothetical protein
LATISLYELLRRVYSRCDCDTTTINEWNSETWNRTTDINTNCPYCTDTTDGYTEEQEEEHWRKEEAREDLQLDELGRLARKKEKVYVPIIPKNIINKTMSRRMMNGRH